MSNMIELKVISWVETAHKTETIEESMWINTDYIVTYHRPSGNLTLQDGTHLSIADGSTAKLVDYFNGIDYER